MFSVSSYNHQCLSLSNRWNYYPDPSLVYSSQFINHFVSTLSSLSNLKELSVVFESNDFHPDFSLEPISGLLSISIEWFREVPPPSHVVQEISKLLSRCHDLESLVFTMPERYCIENTPSSGDIFSSLVSLPPGVHLLLRKIKFFGVSIKAVDFVTHLRHFKSLDTLDILSNGDVVQSATTMARICQHFEHERVYLKHFVTESIYPPEIFHYLSSFSGLEHLCFHPYHSDDDSTELVDRFFFFVLPLHSHTLKSLEFGTHEPTAWTKLNEVHLAQVEKCTSLREILCWICCQTPRKTYTDEFAVSHLRNS